jgi:hypothetical protein
MGLFYQIFLKKSKTLSRGIMCLYIYYLKLLKTTKPILLHLVTLNTKYRTDKPEIMDDFAFRG